MKKLIIFIALFSFLFCTPINAKADELDDIVESHEAAVDGLKQLRAELNELMYFLEQLKRYQEIQTKSSMLSIYMYNRILYWQEVKGINNGNNS